MVTLYNSRDLKEWILRPPKEYLREMKFSVIKTTKGSILEGKKEKERKRGTLVTNNLRHLTCICIMHP